MALANYGDLQSAVAGWLNRTDLTARIPDFITLAESSLNAEMRLRTMETEASLTILDGTRSIPLPDDFLEPLDLWAVESYGRRPLRYLTSPQTRVLTASGVIVDWSIDGEEITVPRPVGGDMALVLEYLAAFKLSDTAPTNWLLTHFPNVYLFAALVEAAPYLRDTDLLAIWSARLERAKDECNRQAARSKGLSTLSTDLPRSTRWNRSRGGHGRYG